MTQPPLKLELEFHIADEVNPEVGTTVIALTVTGGMFFAYYTNEGKYVSGWDGKTILSHVTYWASADAISDWRIKQ